MGPEFPVDAIVREAYTPIHTARKQIRTLLHKTGKLHMPTGRTRRGLATVRRSRRWPAVAAERMRGSPAGSRPLGRVHRTMPVALRLQAS
jgi:hypothetical protein